MSSAPKRLRRLGCICYHLPADWWPNPVPASDVWPAGVTTAGQQSCRHSEKSAFLAVGIPRWNSSTTPFPSSRHRQRREREAVQADGWGKKEPRKDWLYRVTLLVIHSAAVLETVNEIKSIKLSPTVAQSCVLSPPLWQRWNRPHSGS